MNHWKYYRFKEAIRNHCTMSYRTFKFFNIWMIPFIYNYLYAEITKEEGKL